MVLVPREDQTGHEEAFVYWEGGQTLEQNSWRGGPWPVCVQEAHGQWPFMMSLNFWPHLKWSSSWNRWSSCIPSNWKSLSSSSSSHIIPHPGGKERVCKLNPNLFSPFWGEEMTYSKDKKHNIKWCSDVRLHYAHQSTNLIFHCDKYIIMITLVTSVRNFKISALLFSKILVLCVDFSWDRVNLLGVSFGSVLEKKSVDNRGMSSLFAEQIFHREEAFSATM